MSALTETELVEAVRQGRREGQTEMVSRYAERVFAMVARHVRDMMDAQELTQDTFLRAFNHVDSQAPHTASLSTWLWRIAYHRTLDHVRRRRPVIVAMEDNTDISDEELEAELSTGREERIEQLMEVIDELPDDERMLLTLYYFEDRPLAEITYITGIEPAALANRLYKTRKKLYRKLNN